MKTPSFIKNAIYSWAVFFATVILLSVGYAAWNTTMGPVTSGSSLTATWWNALVDNITDLNDRVSGVTSSLSALQVSAGNLWAANGGNISYTGGNVGIGTTTPNASLEVKRTTADGQFAVWIEWNNTTNYGLGVNIAGTGSTTAIADFRSENTSRLFIRANGNVGIGTANPTSRLTVANSLGSSGTPSVTFANWNTGMMFFNEIPAGAWSGIQADGDSAIIVRGNGIDSSTGGLSLGLWSSSAKGIRIAASGNVGIGTNTPQSKLQVGNWSQISDSPDGRAFYGSNAHVNSSNQLIISNTHNTSWGLGMNGWYNSYPAWADISFISKLWDVTAGDIIDPLANAKMTIKSSGNVGIGTTTPAQKLSVAGTIESTSGGYKFPDGTTQTTAAGASAPHGKQLFTTSGTFTIPAGVTTVWVSMVGGGGGGGKGYNGSGGAGGAVMAQQITVSGTSVAVTIGAGWASTAAGTASSFGGYLSVNGGSAGGSGTSGAQGAGGASGGVGGGAGAPGYGYGGTGGSGIFGSGGAGGGLSGSSGSTGGGYGGWGSGGMAGTTIWWSGWSGSPGMVLVEW